MKWDVSLNWWGQRRRLKRQRQCCLSNWKWHFCVTDVINMVEEWMEKYKFFKAVWWKQESYDLVQLFTDEKRSVQLFWIKPQNR